MARSRSGQIKGLVVQDLLIDSSTFAGVELQGSYPITAALFENISVQHAGTSGIHLNSNLQGDITFSFVSVTESEREALTNYAPKLRFHVTIGKGNNGWQSTLP
jgi:hypothetical protein